MILVALILGGFLLLSAGWFMHRYADEGNATDVAGWPLRIVATMFLLGMVVASHKVFGAAVTLFVVLVASVLLGVLWIPTLVHGLLSPLSNSLTGGDEKIERRPFYYRAQGLRKRGDYSGALEAVRAELEKFPRDLEGRLLEAEILAVNLRQPEEAEAVLQAALDESGWSPEDECLMLNQLADLRLKHLKNPDAARATWETLIASFPETTAAHLARQRLAHFGVDGSAPPAPRLVVQQHTIRLGLTADLGASQRPVEDPTRTARELVEHLQTHPQDWETRERLARLYADALDRVDLATLELEQLLAEPGVPVRHVVRWYNDLAELQLKAADGVTLARQTLERLIARFPDSAHANQAQARIRHLAWDERARKDSKTVSLDRPKLPLNGNDPAPNS